jgi:hypothetical protein
MSHTEVTSARYNAPAFALTGHLLPFIIFIIFLVGFYIRYLYLIVWGGATPDYLVWANKNYFGGLTSVYFSIARNILAGNWTSIGTIYPPGYPFFLALVDGLTGDFVNARLVQAVIDSAAVYPLAYVLSRLRVSRPIVSLACLFYAIAPWWAASSTFLLAEALLPAMVISVLAGMIWCRDHRGLAPWFVFGALSGVLPMFRPDMTLLVAPLAVWALLAGGKNRWRAAVLVGLGFFALPLAWATFNWIEHGEFLSTSHSQWYAVWSGLGQVPNDLGYAVDDGRAGLVLQNKGIIHHTPAAEAYWREQYLEAWRLHPGHVVATILYRINYILHGADFYVFPFQDLVTIFSIGPGLLIAAVTLLVVRGRFTDAYLVSGPMVYALLSLGLVYVESRYVRYASISYVLACAVAIQAGVELLGKLATALHPRLPRILVPLAVVAVVAGILSELGARIPLLLNESRQALTVVSPLNPTQATSRLTTISWHDETSGMELARASDGTMTLITSEGTKEYQLSAWIPVGNASKLEIRTAINLVSGAVYVGVLSNDKSRWLGGQVVSQPGLAIHEFTASSTKDGVVLMLANHLDRAGRSRAVLESLDVFLWCLPSSGTWTAYINAIVPVVPVALVPCGGRAAMPFGSAFGKGAN